MMSNKLVTSLLLLQSLIFSVYRYNDTFFSSIELTLAAIIVPLVILIPVSAVLAFIPWFMLFQIQEKRYPYGNFWVTSMALVCLFLVLGSNYFEQKGIAVKEASDNTPIRQ